ncbi:excalibur calcium-binding domain-containing protein [Streptomyces sp. NPDC006984]|uniref:excalibur calcium-binding domain-containing protein n=1 Tax=Streptomyces sp. NPDC006984 TaxID=3155463 RepID=UPI0033C582E3
MQETAATGPDPTCEEPAPDVYDDNCDEARGAGAAPLSRGAPGCAPLLDRDDDGVACEPYFGRRPAGWEATVGDGWRTT